MSDLVDPEEIEQLVGARRHQTRHIGRAVSEDETVYVLHSARCKASGIDLRDCWFSRALDRGLDLETWEDWMDRPVHLWVDDNGLMPVSDVSRSARR